MDITGTIKEATFLNHAGERRSPCIRGYVYGDSKARFPDGEIIRTSKIEQMFALPDGAILVKTRFSAYRVEFAPAEGQPPVDNSRVKIVCTDNYARETVAERLIAENLHEREAKIMCDALNTDPQRSDEAWFTVRVGDYKLWRGMEELI